MIKKHASNLLVVFVMAGVFVSGWSLANHYRTAGSSACDVNRTFNCDVVNKGAYSEIGSIPVAAIGIGGYLLLGLLAGLWLRSKDPVYLQAFIGFAIAGLLFSLWLSSIEEFVLATWCLLCLASLSCIVGATFAATLAHQHHHPKVSQKKNPPL
jgi:vitamin-K-epoxide reductase (warfarin-sensitive)